MTTEPYLTAQQVAELLQISRRTVLNLIARGRFPGAYKIDPDSTRSNWRIPTAAIEQYQAKQTQPNA